jgi:hypothetical protein
VKGREEDADATVLFACLKYSRLLRSKIRQKGYFPHQAAPSVGARKIIQIPHGFAQTELVVQLSTRAVRGGFTTLAQHRHSAFLLSTQCVAVRVLHALHALFPRDFVHKLGRPQQPFIWVDFPGDPSKILHLTLAEGIIFGCTVRHARHFPTFDVKLLRAPNEVRPVDVFPALSLTIFKGSPHHSNICNLGLQQRSLKKINTSFDLGDVLGIIFFVFSLLIECFSFSFRFSPISLNHAISFQGVRSPGVVRERPVIYSYGHGIGMLYFEKGQNLIIDVLAMGVCVVVPFQVFAHPQKTRSATLAGGHVLQCMIGIFL